MALRRHRRRPTPNAMRLRRFYARQRKGYKIFALELDDVEIEEMLTNERLLPPGQDHDHATVTAALQEFVRQLSKMRFNLP